jgi:hypothetical protein
MVRHNIRMMVAFGVTFGVVAWVCLMISFWLPGLAGDALEATAWAMGIPGLVVAAAGVIFERELVEEFESRSEQAQKGKALRCSDCGTKILDASGTTIGDQIEGELMLEQSRDRPERRFP